MAGRDNSSFVCPAMAPPIMHRLPVSGKWVNLSHSPRQGGPPGLARERANMNAMRFSPHVVITIQSAKASSTHSLYDCKEWCDRCQLISYQCSVSGVLCFLQDLMDFSAKQDSLFIPPALYSLSVEIKFS